MFEILIGKMKSLIGCEDFVLICLVVVIGIFIRDFFIEKDCQH